MYRTPTSYSVREIIERAQNQKQARQAKSLNAYGYASGIFLLSLMIAVTLAFGVSYQEPIQEISQFVTGNYRDIEQGREDIFRVFLTILAFNCIEIVLSISYAIAMSNKLSRPKVNPATMKPIHMVGTVFLEELFARFLFVGILTHIFQGTFAFYVLALTGNALWAWVHYLNYAPQDRKVRQVLPQFFGGIFLIVLYVKFGFWVTFVAHVLYNVSLFSLAKVQLPGKQAQSTLIWYGGVLVISFLLILNQGVDLTMLSAWTTTGIDPLDGFGFFDYFLMLVFMLSIGKVVSELLLLDRIKLDSGNMWATTPQGALLASVAVLVIVLLPYFFIEQYIAGEVAAATSIAVSLCFLTSAKSGSAMVRTMLINLPYTFVFVACVIAVGILQGFVLVLTVCCFELLPYWVTKGR